jgi:predicted metal-dependent phosphoesterase TrpH
MIKVELHAHTGLDPIDYIPHTTRELIDRAAVLGYAALAVTLHDCYYDPVADRDYARSKDILLIAGIERTIHRRHILLLNFPADCARVETFGDVRVLKQRFPNGLVIAPHAFYPIQTAIGAEANEYEDVIDAIEVNSMFTPWLNFNNRAVAWARAHGKPLVGNTDLHLLEQLGTTYTLVDAPPGADADSICAAIRDGKVDVRANALSSVRAAWIFSRMLAWGAVGRLRAATKG